MKKKSLLEIASEVPILKPIPDYLFGAILIIPHTTEHRAALTDSVAKAKARLLKGDIAIIKGDQVKAYTLEEFEALIWPEVPPTIDAQESPRILTP